VVPDDGAVVSAGGISGVKDEDGEGDEEDVDVECKP
jgi:hypothetical protein